MNKINPLLAIFVISIICTCLYAISYNKKDKAEITPPDTKNPDYSNLDSTEPNISVWQDSLLVFKSSFYDIERNGEIVQTIYANTIHEFDFHKKLITRKILQDETWVIASFTMNSFYKQTGLAATTYVFTINDDVVKEIWFCPYVPNLGYDNLDGSRIACYDITEIKNGNIN